MADRYTTDSHGRTMIVERRSGSAGMIVALIIGIALVAAIAFFLFAKHNREQRQSDAVVTAAQSSGDAAASVDAKISRAADRIAPKR